MKYCVTLQLREFSKFDKCSIPNYHSRYYEASSVRDLNDWLHHHICNTVDNSEIINFFFEVVDK